MEKEGLKNQNVGKRILEAVFLLFLVLYPLRHVNIGLDIWDTGYNYANFRYMGLEHMDSMWLFSTYLATAVGHFFTLLPFGTTLIGMNVYTGLTVSALAVMGYYFCTRVLKISTVVTFLGEFLAISLCWCPTAKLYDYLTYILFSGCVIFLYLGLTKEKKRYLFLAGICLGTNILVRFSNVPEAGMILAVWVYAFYNVLEKQNAVCEKDNQKNEAADREGSAESNDKSADKSIRNGFWTALWKELFPLTLWCLAGYLTALGGLLLWMGIRYGFGNYVTGILRLFAMTDTATDYQASSMLLGAVYPYIDLCKYYFPRMLVFVLAAFLLWCAGDCFPYCTRSEKAKKLLTKPMRWGSRIASVSILGVLIYWLYAREYCSLLFYSYDPMYRPAVWFMLITYLAAAWNVLRKGTDKKEKLYGSMVILLLLLTSLGSNNNVYPSINHLFLIAPYTVWQFVQFTKWALRHDKTLQKHPKEMESLWKFGPGVMPLVISLWVLTGMLFVQAGGFGVGFVFMDSTGVRDISSSVDRNPVLKGVKMSELRAGWLQKATDYVNQNGLAGKEVIPFGYIPSVAFYLEMPPAFNTWSDLASYGYSTMEADLQELTEEIRQDGVECPVVMLEHTYHLLALGDKETLVSEGMDAAWVDVLAANPKWMLLKDYLEEYGYVPTFDSVKLAIWEAK